MSTYRKLVDNYHCGGFRNNAAKICDTVISELKRPGSQKIFKEDREALSDLIYRLLYHMQDGYVAVQEMKARAEKFNNERKEQVAKNDDLYYKWERALRVIRDLTDER